jgi:hypothetical protein
MTAGSGGHDQDDVNTCTNISRSRQIDREPEESWRM